MVWSACATHLWRYHIDLSCSFILHIDPSHSFSSKYVNAKYICPDGYHAIQQHCLTSASGIWHLVFHNSTLGLMHPASHHLHYCSLWLLHSIVSWALDLIRPVSHVLSTSVHCYDSSGLLHLVISSMRLTACPSTCLHAYMNECKHKQRKAHANAPLAFCWLLCSCWLSSLLLKRFFGLLSQCWCSPTDHVYNGHHQLLKGDMCISSTMRLWTSLDLVTVELKGLALRLSDGWQCHNVSAHYSISMINIWPRHASPSSFTHAHCYGSNFTFHGESIPDRREQWALKKVSWFTTPSRSYCKSRCVSQKICLHSTLSIGLSWTDCSS